MIYKCKPKTDLVWSIYLIHILRVKILLKPQEFLTLDIYQTKSGSRIFIYSKPYKVVNGKKSMKNINCR